MKQIVQDFLDIYWKREGTLLLGYSGGPDSKALLYALLECGVKNLKIAHVDHGWREESAREAEILKEEVAKFHLPFYSIRLKGAQTEEEARHQRLAFFRSIPHRALLLGHQADDWAENALKRVLEGAHLPFLGGMSPVSKVEGMEIWRPFLPIRRSEILSYLNEKGLIPLQDKTNFNPAFLRARMRMEIFPYLNQSFGKEINENLICLGKRAVELKEYLDRKVAQVPISRGPWGLYAELVGLERIEARHWIQSIAGSIPRQKLEMALDWLEQKAPCKQIAPRLYADRGIFFLFNEKEPRFEIPFQIQKGKSRCGDWEIERKKGDAPWPSWRDVWKGEFAIPVNEDDSSIEWIPVPRKIRKQWNEKKVPSFLRDRVPFVVQKGEIRGEFLSGKRTEKGKNGEIISFLFAQNALTK